MLGDSTNRNKSIASSGTYLGRGYHTLWIGSADHNFHAAPWCAIGIKLHDRLSWSLGAESESCTAHCESLGQVCSERFWPPNASAFQSITSEVGVSCTQTGDITYVEGWGDHLAEDANHPSC